MEQIAVYTDQSKAPPLHFGLFSVLSDSVSGIIGKLYCEVFVLHASDGSLLPRLFWELVLSPLVSSSVFGRIVSFGLELHVTELYPVFVTELYSSSLQVPFKLALLFKHESSQIRRNENFGLHTSVSNPKRNICSPSIASNDHRVIVCHVD